jgi:hypothetical protein
MRFLLWLSITQDILVKQAYRLWYGAWAPFEAWERRKRRRQSEALRRKQERGTVFRLRKKGRP